jgi:hypothetical protein
VIIDNSIDAIGVISFEHKVIKMNLVNQTSDASVRSTLLHEMAHLAAGRAGHDSRFFAQLERLLKLKAPLRVSFPENENRVNCDIVPKRFTLCRRALARPYEKRRHSVEASVRRDRLPLHELTPKDIETECEDFASYEDLTWKAVRDYLGSEYGVVDIDGKVLTWAKEYVEAGQRGYRRGRRWYLMYLKEEEILAGREGAS